MHTGRREMAESTCERYQCEHGQGERPHARLRPMDERRAAPRLGAGLQWRVRRRGPQGRVPKGEMEAVVGPARRREEGVEPEGGHGTGNGEG